jgi:hypothetical protein
VPLPSDQYMLLVSYCADLSDKSLPQSSQLLRPLVCEVPSLDATDRSGGTSRDVQPTTLRMTTEPTDDFSIRIAVRQ